MDSIKEYINGTNTMCVHLITLFKCTTILLNQMVSSKSPNNLTINNVYKKRSGNVTLNNTVQCSMIDKSKTNDHFNWKNGVLNDYPTLNIQYKEAFLVENCVSTIYEYMYLYIYIYIYIYQQSRQIIINLGTVMRNIYTKPSINIICDTYSKKVSQHIN